MNHPLGKNMLGAVLAAGLLSGSALAAEPVVKGPESVQDWFHAGKDFIRETSRYSSSNWTRP